MKQVSTLFDALRNEKFAIAVKDDYGIKYYGYEGQGKEWSNWANKVEIKSLEESQIPSGIIQGPYKNISETELKSLIVAFGYGDSSVSNFVKSKSYRHAGSVRIKTASIVPAVIDTPINYFTGYQYSPVISYKCLHIRQSIKDGSLMHEAKVNNYAFNFERWMYNAAPDSPQSKSLRQRVDSHVGRSHERRLGMKIKSSVLNFDKTRKQTGVINSLETKSLNEDIEFKNLGQRLSGGTRLARRAGRAAFARFDPKAWDGDGDGIVQEGTPFQRPAVPGVNDRSTGGAVDTSAATRAWENLSRASSASTPKPPPRRAVTTAPGTPPKRRKMTTAPGTPPKRTVMTNTSSPKPPPPRKPGGEPRIEKPEVSAPRPPAQSRSVSRRVSEARTERQVQGFASRSSKAAARKRPGKDKMKDTDGQIFESLDDAQKEIVISNLKNTYQKLQNNIKEKLGDSTGYGTWWDEFLRNPSKVGSKKDSDGNPWNKESRIAGEALAGLDRTIRPMIEEIDSEIATAQNALQTEQSSPSPDPKEVARLTKSIKKLEDERKIYKQDLDDLTVFSEMFETDNWELMEHLSAQSRSAGLGRTAAGNKVSGLKVEDDPFATTKPKIKIDWKAPSSFYAEYEGYKEGKRAVAGKRKTGKLAQFADRLIDNAAAAKEKRELRKARRGRAIGIGGTRTGPTRREEARRKLKRAGRKIKRKFSGAPTEADILKEINATKEANPTVFGNGRGGKPKITKTSITILSKLRQDKTETVDEDGVDLTKGHKGKNAGALLGQMWNAQGYNGLAEQITQLDAEFLISQGWKPIKRGHGMPPPPDNNRNGAIRYIDDYINDPDRFITGENGAMYGPGEYWSRPNGGWDGYLVGGEARDGSDNLGTLALISPETRVQTIAESSALQKEHNKAWGKVGLALTDIGGGTIGAKDMDPQDLVRELKAALAKNFADGDPFWSSEVGEVMSEFFNFMASATPGERQQIWNAMQYLLKAGQGDSHYTSMLYGYDGVDHLGGDPIVWFNRGALAIVDEAMTLDEIKKMDVKI